MIIKLMGNSGSGKTTAVRQLMDLAQEVTPQREGFRVKGYRLDFEDGSGQDGGGGVCTKPAG